MLENEILAGKIYVQQAMELQEAAKKNYVSKALGEVGAVEVFVFLPPSCPKSLPSYVGLPSLSPTPPCQFLKECEPTQSRSGDFFSTEGKYHLILL